MQVGKCTQAVSRWKLLSAMRGAKRHASLKHEQRKFRGGCHLLIYVLPLTRYPSRVAPNVFKR